MIMLHSFNVSFRGHLGLRLRHSKRKKKEKQTKKGSNYPVVFSKILAIKFGCLMEKGKKKVHIRTVHPAPKNPRVPIY